MAELLGVGRCEGDAVSGKVMLANFLSNKSSESIVAGTKISDGTKVYIGSDSSLKITLVNNERLEFNPAPESRSIMFQIE